MKRMVFVFMMVSLFCVTSSFGTKSIVDNYKNETTENVCSDSVDIENKLKVDYEYAKFKKVFDAFIEIDEISEFFMPENSYYEYELNKLNGDVKTITAVNYNLADTQGNKFIGDTLELVTYSYDINNNKEMIVEEHHHNILYEYYYDILDIVYPSYDNEKRTNGKYIIVSKYNDNGQLMERAKYIHNNELVSKTVNVISYDGVIVESLTLNSFFYTFYDGKDNSLSDSEFEEEVRTKYKYDKKGNCIEEYQCIYRNNMDYNYAYVSVIEDKYDYADDFVFSYTFVDHDDKEKYSYSEILKTYTYDNKGKCVKETKTEFYYNLNHNEKTIANQTETKYKYDANENLVEKNTYRDNELRLKLVLDYDNENNVIEAKTYTYNNGVETLAEKIKYDITYVQ